MKQINDYEKNKRAPEQEIAQLITQNKSDEKLVFEYEKQIAIYEYQQSLIISFAYPPTEIPLWSKEERINKENTLRNQFGLSEKDLITVQQDALDDLKTGVPSLGLTGNLEMDDKVMQKEKLSGIAKIGKNMDSNNEETKIKRTGENAAVQVIESAYIKKKNMANENLSNLKKKIESNKNTLQWKQTQLEGLTVEYNRLQKVFQKYGKDILQSNDKAKIIQFGNECRDALNIRIEERY